MASWQTEVVLHSPKWNWVQVFSDWNESNPRKAGADQIGVTSKMNCFSISKARSGSSISSRLQMNSSRSLFCFALSASYSPGSARWLLKPPEPLATQTQEPKTKNVPSLGTTQLKLNSAIKFTSESQTSTQIHKHRLCRFTSINYVLNHVQIHMLF